MGNIYTVYQGDNVIGVFNTLKEAESKCKEMKGIHCWILVEGLEYKRDHPGE
jgi:hypothetical protein